MLGIDTWTWIGIILLASVLLVLVGGALMGSLKQREATQRAADRAARRQKREPYP